MCAAHGVVAAVVCGWSSLIHEMVAESVIHLVLYRYIALHERDTFVGVRM
jgi:hypothetical protein